MTHPVLAEHPRIIELDAQMSELQQAERASKARVAASVDPYHAALAKWEAQADQAISVDPYHAALAKWEAQADQAILRGEEPAPKPDAPDLGRDEHAAGLFLQRRTQLQAERKATLVEICSDVEIAALARERILLTDARRLVGKLRELADEHDGLLAAVREVRTAVDSTGDERPVPPRTSRMREHVDVPALVTLVQAGGSAFDVEPVPGLPPPVGEPEPPAREPAPQRGVQL